jgi:hypothetical protein
MIGTYRPSALGATTSIVPPARLERATNSLGNAHGALGHNDLASVDSAADSRSVQRCAPMSVVLTTNQTTTRTVAKPRQKRNHRRGVADPVALDAACIGRLEAQRRRRAAKRGAK